MFKDCNSLLGLTIVDKLKYVDNHEKIESYLSKCGEKENNNSTDEDKEFIHEIQVNNDLKEFYNYNYFYENYNRDISEIKKHKEENLENPTLIYLKLLELQSFHLNVKYMFYNCFSLKTIDYKSRCSINITV